MEIQAWISFGINCIFLERFIITLYLFLSRYLSEIETHTQSHVSVIRTIKHMFKSRGGTIQEEYGDVVTTMLGKEISTALEYTMLHWRDDHEFVRQVNKI